MLRAKQLGQLSQSARSFFLNGSRCSAADGSSCTCCEDESCISKRPIRPNQQYLNPSPFLASKPSLGVPSLLPTDPAKAANVNKLEAGSLPQAIPIANSADCIDGTDFEETAPSSLAITEQFMKVGIAAAGFLSDIVNCRIPMTEGSALASPTQNSMVDRRKPVSNIRPANVKTSRKETVYTKSSGDTSSRSNYTKARPDESGSSKGPTNSTSNGSRNSHSHRTFPEPDRKRSIPQRSTEYSNHFTPSVQHRSEAKFVPESFSVPTKATKMMPGVAPRSRQFSGSGHNVVVESISRVLERFKWGPPAEEALNKLNCFLDAYQANQILKQIQDYNMALGFFYWLKRQPGFKHDGHTYTTMVGILGRARQFKAINKLLDQMEFDGIRPNVVTYNRLIHSYGRANYLSEAINVFNKMKVLGCEPDRVTYCTLIDIHAKAGYLDIAMDMYWKMQEAGLSPDTFTCSVIINCLGKAGHLAAAHRLFSEMINNGCVPNLVTYNIMIALQAKARNYEAALQLYRDMQFAGFEPDKVTFSIIMEVLGHCGYLEEAEVVFAEMKRKNWVPDEPVYGLLVDLWGKAGNVEKAWEWYQAMLNAGLRPNVPTCNSLLSAFLRVHRLSDAYNLLESMLGLGLSPSLQTYTLLLSCCTEARTSFSMGFCCELMTVTGHPAHRFLVSMPEPGPNGQNVRDHVSNFLDLMHSEDRESKRGLIDAVIDFFHKSGLKEEAGSIWEVAAQKNVYPDTVKEKGSGSCYWLINLHVMSDGTAVTALSRTLAWFRREMLESRVHPSRIDIVTGWGRRSRVTGTSLVRQAVQDLLQAFSFPFFMENGNSGCFVGCGEPLNRWLTQPYVERMHLL